MRVIRVPRILQHCELRNTEPVEPDVIDTVYPDSGQRDRGNAHERVFEFVVVQFQLFDLNAAVDAQRLRAAGSGGVVSAKAEVACQLERIEAAAVVDDIAAGCAGFNGGVELLEAEAQVPEVDAIERRTPGDLVVVFRRRWFDVLARSDYNTRNDQTVGVLFGDQAEILEFDALDVNGFGGERAPFPVDRGLADIEHALTVLDAGRAENCERAPVNIDQDVFDLCVDALLAEPVYRTVDDGMGQRNADDDQHQQQQHSRKNRPAPPDVVAVKCSGPADAVLYFAHLWLPLVFVLRS